MGLRANLTQLKAALEETQPPAGLAAIQRVWMNPSKDQPLTAELPAFAVLWDKPATVGFITFGVEKQEQDIIVYFLYKPTGQGVIDQNLLEAMDYRENALDALHAHESLYSTVNWAVPVSVGLPMTLPKAFGGISYTGFEIRYKIVQTRTVRVGN